MNKKWSVEQIPNLAGKTAIVTGANSGLGFEITKVLAQHGARVIMACRNLDKANVAADAIRQGHPRAEIKVVSLDLASLKSVSHFADDFSKGAPHLDFLINNAGLMAINENRTEDGFEMQLGVNHLAHFALSCALMPLLLATPQSRVVSMSSNAHKFGSMNFADLMYEKRRYSRWGAYGQSKLANLLFILELNNRLAGQKNTMALAAHPGVAHTKLGQNGGGITGMAFHLTAPLIGHSAFQGALPALRAATDPDALGGQYYGPRYSMWGAPAISVPSLQARNVEDAQRLWEISEKLTGVKFPAR